MTKWTEENSEGFTAAEIAMLNEAQDLIQLVCPDLDPSTISDALNNAWFEGVTLAELIAAVRLK